MAAADYRVATEATHQLIKTELANIVSKLNAIDSHVDDLATDATLVLVKTELSDIEGKLQTLSGYVNTLAKDTTLGATNTALGLLAKDATLGNTNTALGQIKGSLDLKATDATLLSFANALINVLACVKTVNGEDGDVVLDAADIKIIKTVTNSKTISQVLTELAAAIAATPLTFTEELISGTTDDYKITVTQGTPA